MTKSGHPKMRPASPRGSGKRKRINLALQGGGTHGAFTWGVLDKLLEDGRADIEAISGTSAGAINAAVMASGFIRGGANGGRELLERFWRRISEASSPLTGSWNQQGNGELSPAYMAFDFMTRTFAPGELNIFDINPLRDIVRELVDFAAIRKHKALKLYVNATNVKTGKSKVFEGHELTCEMVMASACLPYLFKTVKVGSEYYWDGGYSGNPAIYPLFYGAESCDVLLVEVNPLAIDTLPAHAADILDRVNEISFNATLMGEMRAVQFVKKLLSQGHVPEDRYKHIRMHMVEAEREMQGLGFSSKFNTDWNFLLNLRDLGRRATEKWLAAHWEKVGKASSVDVEDTFL